MTRHELKHDRGDRLQNELFNFLTGDFYRLDASQVAPECRELVESTSLLRDEMESAGWQLRLTGKRSAADIAKMDLLFINTRDGRYFAIDLTVNEKLKLKLSAPTLCTMYVLRIEVNEDDRPDIDTKQRLVDMLLDLTESPSLLNLKDTRYPSARSDLTWGEKAEEMEAFKKRVLAKANILEAQHETDMGNGAELRDANRLREYARELDRLLAFLQQEHNVTTDQNLIDQQAHFETFCLRLLPQAARYCLNPDNDPGLRPRQSTHHSRYEAHRDRLLLQVSANFFGVSGIGRLAVNAIENANVKSCRNQADIYARKRLLLADGGKTVVQALIGIIHCTPAQVILGPSFPGAAVDILQTKKKSQCKKKNNKKKKQAGQTTDQLSAA